MNFLQNIVCINGLYDILCALCILKIINIPLLNRLHLTMFHSYSSNQSLFERFLAYGLIRLQYNLMVPYSYYMEALFIANECFIYKTIVFEKGAFVIVSSLFLGYLTHLQ
jgi:hypothetical protein